MSVREIAEFDLKPGTADQFQQTVIDWMRVFREQPGCGSFEIHRPAEFPDRVILIIEWDEIESHTEEFMKSPEYPDFCAAIEVFYASPVKVQHTSLPYVEDTRATA